MSYSSGSCMSGCGKDKKTGDCCNSSATICHRYAATRVDAQGMRNSFVYIEDERAYAHVDASGNIAALSNSVLYQDSHVVDKSGKYKQVRVIDTVALKEYIYSIDGTKAYSVTLTEE